VENETYPPRDSATVPAFWSAVEGSVTLRVRLPKNSMECPEPCALAFDPVG